MVFSPVRGEMFIEHVVFINSLSSFRSAMAVSIFSLLKELELIYFGRGSINISLLTERSKGVLRKGSRDVEPR